MSLAIKGILKQLQEEPQFEESSFSEQGLDTRFLIKAKSYTPQFSQIYFLRLAALKSAVLAAANKLWTPLLGKFFRVFNSSTIF